LKKHFKILLISTFYIIEYYIPERPERRPIFIRP